MIIMRALFLLLIIASAKSRFIIPHPNPLSFLKINTTTQYEGTCYFGLQVNTSCSSPIYTEDHISVRFGDSDGIKIEARNLDDPAMRTLQRGATDNFDLYGPCTNDICFMYLYRSGDRGWIPDSLTVSAYNKTPVTFSFNVNIPNGEWFGFNNCNITRADS